MQQLYSTKEVAKLLGISAVAVFKQIKSGKLKAQKIGRAYVISHDDLPLISSQVISDAQKLEIEKVVKRVISEYGEALRKLKDT